VAFELRLLMPGGAAQREGEPAQADAN